MKTFNFIFIVTFLTFASCHKGAESGSEDCYLNALENFKKQKNALQIDEYTFDKSIVFYLDDGATHYDGISYFIDIKCDTICESGGFRIEPPACLKKLTFVKTIWKK